MAAYAEPASADDVDPVNTASVPSGWAIQVASSPKQVEAQAFLDKTTKQAPKVLADASGFTVAFDKDGVTYYRARFGGFGSKTAAWNACTRFEEEENRLLRRPAIGRRGRANLPEMFCVEGD